MKLSTEMPMDSVPKVSGSVYDRRLHLGKATLDEEAACSIYRARPTPDDLRAGRARELSLALAARHGVTAKTIRDIWNRCTWSRATRALWTLQELRSFLVARERRRETATATRNREEAEVNEDSHHNPAESIGDSECDDEGKTEDALAGPETGNLHHCNRSCTISLVFKSVRNIFL
mmetsp:Transcript_84819/g.226333  ORF Transcript_84819/g.226333 Transcript_84819/m.226333 type:complete len:176 (-) Transcript_84819:4-531(-)